MKFSFLLISFAVLVVIEIDHATAVMYCASPPYVENAKCYEGYDDVSNSRRILIRKKGRSSTLQTYRQGSVVHFKCNDGYELRGDSEVTCGRTGEWMVEPPTCVSSRTPLGDDECWNAPTIDYGVCTPVRGRDSSEEVSSEVITTTGYWTTEAYSTEWPETIETHIMTSTEPWADETTEPWGGGTTEPWGGGTTEPWDFGTTEPWTTEEEDRFVHLVTTRPSWLPKRKPSRKPKPGRGRKGRITTTTTTTTTTIPKTTNSRSKRRRGLNGSRITGRRTKTRTPTTAITTTISRRGLARSANPIATAQCRCQNGRELEGSSEVSCTGGEYWDDLPTCKVPGIGDQQLSCDALPPISGTSCRKHRSGTSRFLVMDSDIVDDDDDQWIDMDDQPSNGTRRLRSDRMFQLRRPSGPRTRRPSGRRTRTPTTPQTRYNSRTSVGRSQAGDIYDCKCKDGYVQQTHTSFIVCLENGYWSQLPKCRPTSRPTTISYCGMPIEVENAKCFEELGNGVQKRLYLSPRARAFQNVNIRAGQGVKYQCNSGFKMVGNANVMCSSRGTWSPFPTCVHNGCEVPEIDYGACQKVLLRGDDDVLNIGQSAECSCDNGYIMEGMPVVKCIDSDEYDFSLPRCRRIPTTAPRRQCPTPPFVPGSGCDCPEDAYGQFANQVFYSGDTVRYTCKRGFRMSGDAVIECSSSGRWSTAPRCRWSSVHTSTTCSYPRKIRHASCGCYAKDGGPSTFYVNDKIRFSCDPGYSLRNHDGVITCLNTGKWSRYPRCMPDN